MAQLMNEKITHHASRITIVAIHGNGGGGFRFERMLPYVPDGVEFRPITLPGFANTPANPQLQTLTDYANHLHSEIADVAQPLVLLGTGIGGTIALEYAQQYEDSLAGIILHAPVGTRLDTRWFPRLMQNRLIKRFVQEVISSRQFRPLFTKLFFHYHVPKSYLDRFFEEYGHCSVFAQMFDIITPEWFGGLHPIQVPTALLWGEKERVLSVDQLDDYKQLVPNHLVKTVPDWDHFPMVEQPEQFTEVMVYLANQLLSKS